MLAGGKAIKVARTGRFSGSDVFKIKNLLEPLFMEKSEETLRQQGVAWVNAFDKYMRGSAIYHGVVILLAALWIAFTLLPLVEPIGNSPAGHVMGGTSAFVGGAASFLGAWSCTGETTTCIKILVSKAELEAHVLKIHRYAKHGIAIVFFIMIFSFGSTPLFKMSHDAATRAFHALLDGFFFYPVGVGFFSILTVLLALLNWSDRRDMFKKELGWCRANPNR